MAIGLIAALIAAGSASIAQADVIYGDSSTPSGPNLGLGSDAEDDFMLASGFELTSGANVIRDIHWWGWYSGIGAPGSDGVADDDFTIRIFADDGSNKPADTPLFIATPEVTRVDTGVVPVVTPMYAYSAYIDPLTLSPDTPYYLSIQNDTTGDPDIWFWATLQEVDAVIWTRYQDNPWFTSGSDADRYFAFYLTDDIIPEPATTSILSIGMAALVLRGLRRRSEG